MNEGDKLKITDIYKVYIGYGRIRYILDMPSKYSRLDSLSLVSR